MSVIERIADGLRIPGHMLGLAARDWESCGAAQPLSLAVAPRHHLWTFRPLAPEARRLSMIWPTPSS
jgi:hypothetical protein